MLKKLDKFGSISLAMSSVEKHAIKTETFTSATSQTGVSDGVRYKRDIFVTTRYDDSALIAPHRPFADQKNIFNHYLALLCRCNKLYRVGTFILHTKLKLLHILFFDRRMMPDFCYCSFSVSFTLSQHCSTKFCDVIIATPIVSSFG